MSNRSITTSERPLRADTIVAAQPGDILRDDEVKGLHLRCFPARKVFYLYYRTKGGVERRPRLGTFGSITLAQARKAARELLGQVAAGRDPGQEQADKRSEKTLQELWDAYWKRHGSKKKSGFGDEWLWKKTIQSVMGKKRLSEISYESVADFHEELSEETPTQANRALALLSKMYSFAIRPMKWTDENPCKGVARNQENKRRRYMTPEEAARIAEQLRLEADANPASAAFIYLLILTGARRGEIAKAKWTDLQGNKLVLKEHKTDGDGHARVIQLPPQAMAVIQKLPQTLGGTITGIQSPTKLWQKIRVNAKCEDLRIHDLRHSFASAAVSAGLTLAQIGELLGHATSETTKRYAHLIDEAAAQAAASTADVVSGMMKIS